MACAPSWALSTFLIAVLRRERWARFLAARLRARRLQAAGQADDEEEALGGGDVYLAGVLGLMLGWPFIVNGLVIGVLLGGLVSFVLIVALLLRRRYMSDALMTFIPYGPYFIISAFYLLYL